MKTEKEICKTPKAPSFEDFMKLLGKLSPEDQEKTLRELAAIIEKKPE